MTSIEAATTGPWTRDNGILRSPLLASVGLDAGFTTRVFGSMGDAITPLEEQRRNRATFARRLGYHDVVRVRQVHGEAVVKVDGPTSSPWPEADALWSEERGLLLGIVAADCVPVLVADAEGALGIAHAGWRGTSLGVARALVRSMAAGGVHPSRLVAALGPSIGPCCYTIDAERAALVRARLGPGNEDIVAGGRHGPLGRERPAAARGGHRDRRAVGHLHALRR